MAETKSNTKKDCVVDTMLEQMIETRSCKASRGLAECSKCRLCGQQRETGEHLLAGCKVLENNKYIKSRKHSSKMI